MNSKEARKILGVNQTMYLYRKNKIIKYYRINSKHFIYDDDTIYKLIGAKKIHHKRINVSYSRVSSGEQKINLKEQSQRIYEYCISKGISLDKQFEDVKSGMNFTDRKQFNELIESIIAGKIEFVIIENKDRLCRFGYDLLETVCKYYGTKILVINDAIQNKTYEQELTDDLISIIHYFSMKSYSHRRKLNKLKRELELETK